LYSHIEKQICEKILKGFNSAPPLELRPNTYFNTAEPTTEPRTIQTPVYISEHPLLIPLTSYNLYRTHCIKQNYQPR